MRDSTPFESIGGADTVRAVVTHFYALLDRDPAYAALRAIHDADLEPTRESLRLFLTAWLGGPRDWFEARPGTCVMGLHRAIGVTPGLAAEWVAAMRRALAADPRTDTPLGRELGAALERMAQAMIARPVAAAP